MSDILVGKDALDYLTKERFIDKRREAVQVAWGIYRTEVYRRVEQGDPEPYKYKYDELSYQTNAFIRREAKRWATSCREYRLYRDDFEEEFRLVGYKTSLWYGGQGSYFDYLRASVRNAGRNMISFAKTDVHGINHLAVSLEEQFHEVADGVDVEATVIAQDIVEQLETDTSLTDKERHLLHLLKRFPDANNQELSDMMELGHREKARRIRQRLCRKGLKYFDVD